MSEGKMRWVVPDHEGFIHPELAKPGRLEELFQDPLEKYNHCHGAKGQFCSGGSKGGGGGRGGSAAEDKKASSKELSEHPPVPGARVKLAPLVGQQVTIHYWVETPGRTGQDRCLRDIKVEGKPIKYGHMWAQKIPADIKGAKYGQQQKAVGTVYRYKKTKGWDWAIGDIHAVVNKSEEPLIKYNHCHGAKGRFCSSGGTGGGGGGAAAETSPGDERGAQGFKHEPVAYVPGVEGLKDMGLEHDQYIAVSDYAREGYAKTNSALRNLLPSQWTEEQTRKIDLIDKAIDSQPGLIAPMKVHRGINYGNVFGKRDPKELVGAKIIDKGFMSTSTNSEMAERFGNGTVMNISLPKGQKALNVAKLIASVSARQERELILPRGTQLEITHVAQTKGGFLGIGKKTYIEAKVVPVEKALIEKYNHCHGAKGRFCSSGGTGGGGGSVSAPEMAGSEEFQAREDLSPEYLGQPDTVVMEITESNAFTRLVNKQNVPDEEALKMVEQADNTVGKTKIERMKTMELASIPEKTALAECEMTFWPEGKGYTSKETLRIDMDANKMGVASHGWQQDRMEISKGRLPWLAGGYASTPEGNKNALINHEVGHAALGEYTLKKPVSKWADPNNPLQGTKDWHKTISDAAAAGWPGVSMYGRQSPGEMFAESFAALNIRSSTGNKKVDDFVLKVVKNGR